jgi:UDP-N-acetylmuramoyl-tripeptide--D-alanyl-D-alanine ligase
MTLRFSLDFLLSSTGGSLVGGKMPIGASGVSIDSRKIKRDQLFVAIEGPNFDGHDYVAEAFEKGSVGAIVEKYPQIRDAKHSCGAIIKVESTQKALLEMSRHWRNSFPDLKVAAITGSNGKTTTKNMTHSILSVSGSVLSTHGNLNNHIGLPLSLLKLEEEHDFCVLEMGMNSFGEIRTLADVASPDVGTITTVGKAHLEEMKDLEGVARAKGELVENFGEENTFCVNIDDPWVGKIADSVRCRKITYGIVSREAFIKAGDISHEGMESIEFTIHIGEQSARTRIKGIGTHNVSNALSASALGYSLGCGMNEILAGLEKYVPSAMRLEVLRTPFGFRVINDAYNANPDSMRAALDELAGHRGGKTKAVAVLGDMLELGESSEREHELIGEHVSQLGLDMVVAMGEFSRSLVSAVRGQTECHVAKSPQEAAALLLEVCGEDDVVLVKGSRGMRMEAVIQTLYKK